jgi:uncharacterized membrane protein YeaQ/YmgE (transglycosylase-associated protein family)
MDRGLIAEHLLFIPAKIRSVRWYRSCEDNGMYISHFIAQTPAPADDQHGVIISIIIWIFIGLVAGFLGSKIVNKSGDGIILDVVLGLIGSVVGGFLFSLVGIHAGGLIGSIVVATIGAIIVLVIYHKLIRGNRAA